MTDYIYSEGYDDNETLKPCCERNKELDEIILMTHHKSVLVRYNDGHYELDSEDDEMEYICPFCDAKLDIPSELHKQLYRAVYGD